MSETSYGSSTGDTARIASSKVVVSTDQLVSTEHKLLFGNTKGPENDILGDYPSENSVQLASSSTGVKSNRETFQQKSHKHAPPGMPVTGSHVSKLKGKASTVISVSLECPETHTISTINERGIMHSVMTTTSTSAQISSSSGTPVSESSWLGVLSMGYLGTSAEPGPELKREKYNNTFCPPSVGSWNNLASVRAAVLVEDSIVDLTIEMAINLSAELMLGTFDFSQSLPENQFGVMLSLAVAEIFAEVGSSFSVENDTVAWIKAILNFVDSPEGFTLNQDNLEKDGVSSPCLAAQHYQTKSIKPQYGRNISAISNPAKKKGLYSSLHTLSKY